MKSPITISKTENGIPEPAWTAVHQTIDEQCTESRWNHSDAEIIWQLGVKAFQAARAAKATFPHDQQKTAIRLAGQSFNEQKEACVCH